MKNFASSLNAVTSQISGETFKETSLCHTEKGIILQNNVLLGASAANLLNVAF